MDHCFYTGSPVVERHHIFGAYNRERSERHGFVIPLRPDLHPNGALAGPDAKRVDRLLKQMAQRYFEEHYGTRAEFIQEFGKSYL